MSKNKEKFYLNRYYRLDLSERETITASYKRGHGGPGQFPSDKSFVGQVSLSNKLNWCQKQKLLTLSKWVPSNVILF